ncbi:TetR family transcriptional regulator [Streptacidiphilus sp. N1-12]|uniref:TetR family transcriptional regulator n=2 Tax=Streptacidiphilus alkalitolerans TaxID=3342712 RepID=A0ABV6VIF5_9ACTN
MPDAHKPAPRPASPHPASPQANSPGPATRPRDAEARRADILQAARYAFGRHAYADTTIAGIAQAAGVSPALVMKYFGSKEQLFSQVFTFEDDAEALLGAPLDTLARHMVLHLLATQHGEARDPILRIAFSRLHDEQGRQARANFRAQVITRLAERLPGPDAPLRAEMAVGILLGLGALYAMVQAETVRALTSDQIADHYAPLIQPLLSDPSA